MNFPRFNECLPGTRHSLLHFSLNEARWYTLGATWDRPEVLNFRAMCSNRRRLTNDSQQSQPYQGRQRQPKIAVKRWLSCWNSENQARLWASLIFPCEGKKMSLEIHQICEVTNAWFAIPFPSKLPLNTPDTNVVNQPRSCTPSQPLNRTSALRGWSINKPMAYRHWSFQQPRLPGAIGIWLVFVVQYSLWGEQMLKIVWYIGVNS